MSVSLERAVYFDHEAGHGGGFIDLVMLTGGARTRPEAAEWLAQDGILPQRESAEASRSRRHKEDKDRARKIATALGLWRKAIPLRGSVGEIYLRESQAIGAPLDKANLRFVADCPLQPYFPDERNHPAIIAAVQKSTGNFVGAHISYLTPDGSGKADISPSRKMIGRVHGGHVHLAPGATVIVAEGLETALSAWELGVDCAPNIGAIAALSASGVASFEWPPETRKLLIAFDRDASGAGERAAHALTVRARGSGLSASLLPPPPNFNDWNDAARANAKGFSNE
jgi:phage/plasmid primase-like uncharacterized protein